MLSWLEGNEPVVGLALQAIMAIIWLFYLQIIVMGMARQRRPIILIHRSAGTGYKVRCFVSNMGAEPTYLISLMVEVTVNGKRCHAFVSDREEPGTDGAGTPELGAAQGSIESGAMNDVGSFDDLLGRLVSDLGETGNDVKDLRLTAICTAGYSGQIVAGERDFRVGWKDGVRMYLPVQVSTRQINSPIRQRALRQTLKNALLEEAEGFSASNSKRPR